MNSRFYEKLCLHGPDSEFWEQDDDDLEFEEEEVEETEEEQSFSRFSGIPVEEPFSLLPPGDANPMYDLVLQAIEHQPQMLDMINKVKQVGRAHQGQGEFQSLWNFEAIHNVLRQDEDFMATLRKTFDTITSTPPTPQRQPQKPDRRELYDRIDADIPVTDIGSGSDVTPNLLCRVTDDVECIDPAYEGDFACVTKAKVEEVTLPTERVVTSFNSYTMLSEGERAQVEDTDGMHIYPDVDVFLDKGFAQVEDGKAVFVDKAGKTWRDNIVPKDGMEQEICQGYLARNTYVPRRVAIELTGEATVTVMKNTLSAPGLFPSGDIGYKLDGEFHFLEVGDNKATLTRRNGQARTGVTTSDLVATLFVEKVKSKRGRTHYYLLRVPYCEGFVPFHGSNHLKQFCKRIDLTIDGIRLEPPPSYEKDLEFDDRGRAVIDIGEGDQIPVDGIITRGPVDNYLKRVWTIDIKNVPSFVERFSEKYQVCFTADQLNDNKLREFAVKWDGEIFYFSYVRERPDKRKETSTQEATKLLELSKVMRVEPRLV